MPTISEALEHYRMALLTARAASTAAWEASDAATAARLAADDAHARVREAEQQLARVLVETDVIASVTT